MLLLKLKPAEPEALARTRIGIGPTQKRLLASKKLTSKFLARSKVMPEPSEVPLERA